MPTWPEFRLVKYCNLPRLYGLNGISTANVWKETQSEVRARNELGFELLRRLHVGLRHMKTGV